MNEPVQQPEEGPDMPLPPAVYPLCIVGSALMLEKHFPIAMPEVLLPGMAFSEPASICTVLLAIAFMAWGIKTMRENKTTFLPHRVASRLIENGPFRFSRNPIYFGFTLLLLAVFLANANMWLLILLPLNVWLLHRYVVLPEELNLALCFGEQYTQYKNKVRRWL